MGVTDVGFWVGILVIVLASILLYRAVGTLLVIKKKWWSRLFFMIGCWLLVSMMVYMGDFANLPPTLIIFLLAVWVCCEGSGLKRLTVGMLTASVVLAFNGLHDNCIAMFMPGFVPGYVQGILRCIFVACLYLGISRHRPAADFELSKPLWKLMLMLTTLPLGIVISLILFRSPFSMDMGTVVSDIALFLVAVLSFAGLFRAMLVLERQQRLEQENMLAQHNRKYYEAMEGQQFEIRRMKHDLNNHLQALLALPEEKRTAYIEGMLDNPTFVQALHYSGDATVNAVLTAKESVFRQKNISFHVKVDIPHELPFEKADICALFSNALDNAAEACMHLPEAEREVLLTARTGKGMLAVSVKNPYLKPEAGQPEAEASQLEMGQQEAGQQKMEQSETEQKRGKQQKAGKNQGLPKTTKVDAKNHGFGLRSIREVVRKYGGNMEIEQPGGMFTLFLYVPLKIEKTRCKTRCKTR